MADDEFFSRTGGAELEPAASPPEPQPDGFERLVAVARQVTGYDPAAEDEAHDELAAGRTRRWAGRTIFFATLMLAFLNAASIKSWASTLSPSWADDTVALMANLWSDRTSRIGLDRPRDAVADAYKRMKAAGS